MAETLRDGRYVSHGTLGEGTQGTTFDGVDKREGRAVAIKRFQVRGAKSWKDVELAEREARVLSQLHHPKLPAYVDHFEEGGALYLVMERIEGESLAALRKRGGVLGEDDVVRLLRDASDVLDYLHGRAPPVIHRDLKPGNVLRRPDGSYAFVDFGAVRDKLRPEGGSTVVGTFGYMAPEQFQGRASPGSDVYAIGATALTLLTGVEPENLPHKGLGIDVRAALGGRASRPLVEILARMVEPNPDVRPQRIAPLLEGLGARRAAGPERSKLDRKIDEARRKSEYWARRAEREVERLRRRAERRERRFAPPWPVLIFLSVGLTLATIAVEIALRLVVPTLLKFLSLFFGPKLDDAAQRVAEAGKRAGEAMGRARSVVHRGLGPETAAERAMRVGAARTSSRVRIADPLSDPAHDDAVALAETELAEQEAADAKARSKRRDR